MAGAVEAAGPGGPGGLMGMMGMMDVNGVTPIVAVQQPETFESLLCKCRICLDTRGCIDIFEAPRLAESIQLCTNLMVSVKDNFPRKICRSCNRLIQAAMTLRSLACSAEFKLRTLKNLQNTNNSKEICTLECTPDIHFDSIDAHYAEIEDDYQRFEPIVVNNIEIPSEQPKEIVKKERNKPKKRKRNFSKRKNSDANKITKKDANVSNKFSKVNETIKLLHDFKNNTCIDKKNIHNVWNYANVKKENAIAEEKPTFTCDVCSKKCKSRNSLYLHKRYHDEVKPYPCNSCEKQFATKGDLTKHIRVHTGEKPFKCDVCLKSFSQNSTLKTHMKTHSSLSSQSDAK